MCRTTQISRFSRVVRSRSCNLVVSYDLDLAIYCVAQPGPYDMSYDIVVLEAMFILVVIVAAGSTSEEPRRFIINYIKSIFDVRRFC